MNVGGVGTVRYFDVMVVLRDRFEITIIRLTCARLSPSLHHRTEDEISVFIHTHRHTHIHAQHNTHNAHRISATRNDCVAAILRARVRKRFSAVGAIFVRFSCGVFFVALLLLTIA